MDTRDIFAAVALNGLLQGSPGYRVDPVSAAQKAWELAAALIAQKPPAEAGAEVSAAPVTRTRTRKRKA